GGSLVWGAVRLRPHELGQRRWGLSAVGSGSVAGPVQPGTACARRHRLPPVSPRSLRVTQWRQHHRELGWAVLAAFHAGRASLSAQLSTRTFADLETPKFRQCRAENHDSHDDPARSRWHEWVLQGAVDPVNRSADNATCRVRSVAARSKTVAAVCDLCERRTKVFDFGGHRSLLQFVVGPG